MHSNAFYIQLVIFVPHISSLIIIDHAVFKTTGHLSTMRYGTYEIYD